MHTKKKLRSKNRSKGGYIIDAMARFAKGTNNVTKFAVVRHLNGEAHKIALGIENVEVMNLLFSFHNLSHWFKCLQK